jgi:hypothetical protein
MAVVLFVALNEKERQNIWLKGGLHVAIDFRVVHNSQELQAFVDLHIHRP